MFKKLLAALWLSVLSVPAFAASVPLLSGPQDPSQLNATINSVILLLNQSIAPAGNGNMNTGVNITAITSATALLNTIMAANALQVTPTTIASASAGNAANLGASNIVTIGPGPAFGSLGDINVDLGLAPKGQGLVEFVRAASITPNGGIAISTSGAGNNSISPTGYVEWLMIKNPSGNKRFIPLWGCGIAGASTC